MTLVADTSALDVAGKAMPWLIYAFISAAAAGATPISVVLAALALHEALSLRLIAGVVLMVGGALLTLER